MSLKIAISSFNPMEYKVVYFYKYVDLDSPETLLYQIKAICKELKLFGRLLLGKEGINAAVSGTVKDVEEFQIRLRKSKEFSDIEFKEQIINKNPFHKLVIRIRDEIVAFKEKVDMNHKGTYLEPKELKEMIENEYAVVIDVRNDYETKLGKFKNAITIPIKYFRDFPDVLKKLEHFKDKKVVTYCTGGIRCEKASAFMKEKGFKNVYQLHGGILNYLNQFHDENFEGGCFVFDDRLNFEGGRDATTSCKHCSEKSGIYFNCHNIDCDKLFVCCKVCQEKMNKSCSEECSHAPDRRKEIKLQQAQDIIGVVKNYYSKPKVALIKLNKGNISKDIRLGFVGKTTKEFSQEITSIRDYEGNQIEEANSGQLVTLPVKEKVRENDRVILVH